MCTRFVYHGDDLITGFNFDIDLAVWEHKIIADKRKFCIGIKRPDGNYHTYHGVHAGGGAGTLLYVHPNEKGAARGARDCVAISDLVESFVRNERTFSDALRTVAEKKIVYAADASMQAMLSDRTGRVLIVEPGIGYRLEQKRYSLMTNDSLLDPESTKPYRVPGDERYERAKARLESAGDGFSVEDALRLLQEVRQEGLWATRASFAYSVREEKVYYALDGDFSQIRENAFERGEFGCAAR